MPWLRFVNARGKGASSQRLQRTTQAELQGSQLESCILESGLVS